MRIGGSLFLIALGAVLKFAVTYQTSGVNLSTVGVILMVVGIIGLVLTLIMMSTRRRTDVVHERTAPGVATVDDPVVVAPTRTTSSRTTYVESGGYDPTV
jgi:hypothetical protein